MMALVRGHRRCLSSVAGLYLSYYLNVASGAAVVLVATARLRGGLRGGAAARRAGARGRGGGEQRAARFAAAAGEHSCPRDPLKEDAMPTTLVLGYDGSDCARLALDAHHRPRRR